MLLRCFWVFEGNAARESEQGQKAEKQKQNSLTRSGFDRQRWPLYYEISCSLFPISHDGAQVGFDEVVNGAVEHSGRIPGFVIGAMILNHLIRVKHV